MRFIDANNPIVGMAELTHTASDTLHGTIKLSGMTVSFDHRWAPILEKIYCSREEFER